MTEADVTWLTRSVLWGSFGLAALFGAIAQRTHFCTMGAVSDIVNMGDYTRMRQWVLAMGVAMLGFGALVHGGWIDAAKTLYASNRFLWLSGLTGGLMFGVGMVLASGCGNKTLVRIGGGSLKSLVVFLVMAISAYATLRGITAVARVATVDRVAIDIAAGASVPGLLTATGMEARGAALVAALAIGGLFVAWALIRRDFWRLDNLLAGAGLGAIAVGAWWLSGHVGFVAEHPETLEATYLGTNSGKAEALSFIAPAAYTVDWLILFSDKSKVLSVGIVSVLGVIAGSSAMAIASGTFRWEGFGGVEDVANHLVGGVLMGVGGVTALGCTIGQGLSGISTLSLTSFVSVASIIAGAVLGLRYQLWRLERMG